MAITTSVSKTAVTGGESFSYGVAFSFNGLTTGAREGSISAIFPASIVTTPPLVGENEVVKSISYEDLGDGTTLVTYGLGTVTSGTSGSFNFFASFGAGRVDGETFTAELSLNADDVSVETSTAPTVTLTLENNFVLRKFFTAQTAYKAGDELDMTLTITNAGDAGAVIENVIIEDILPDGLEAVTDFIPVGNDSTTGDFADTTYNGKEGTWTDNVLSFTLPSFKGQSYAIAAKVRISEDVEAGDTISNIATWTVDGEEKTEAKANLTIFEEKITAWLSKRAPRYSSAQEEFRYWLRFRNTGTVTMETATLEDTLPSGVDISALSLFTNGAWFSSYELAIYSEEDESLPITVVSNGTGNLVDFDLTPFIPTGSRITKVSLSFAELAANTGTHTLLLFGETNDTVVTGDSIANTATLTATSSLGELTKTSTATTLIEDESYLELRKTASPQSELQPLDEVNISLQAYARNSAIIEPVFADYLPEGLEFVADSASFRYTDKQSNRTYSSLNDDFPSEISLPTTEVLKNYDGTERTLVRWDFSGVTVPYLDTLYVDFKAISSLFPPAEFSNTAYLGSSGETALVANPVTDEEDFDDDGNTTESIAQSNSVAFTALSSSIFKLEKSVKGDLDEEFSTLGTTTAGGTGVYRLYVTNSFDRDLTDINLVDILPYVGDTGVILPDSDRDSQFKVIANSGITISLLNLLGDTVDDVSKLSIDYSTSDNPTRFDENGDEIGEDDDWSSTLPEPISDLRAFRVKTGDDFVLHPYDRLILTWDILTPATASVGEIAYNSFAADAVKIMAEGNVQLLPTEPIKVGIEIVESDTATLGNFVWLDADEDGMQGADEVGENDISVSLYDSSDTLIASTTTDFDPFTGKAGHYLFTGLAAGSYYVKFQLPQGLKFTSSEGDSKADEDSGETALVTLNSGDVNLSLDAGLVLDICEEAPTISASPYCIYVDSVFDPLAGVSATNCDGTDIPLTDDNILRNAVDTSTAGAYQITYTVTSTVNDLSRNRTVTITVVALPEFYDAYTQIIESVALEESALASILQAEADKITTASDLGFDASEILAVNASVERTVKAITTLEMILKGKLEIATENSVLPILDCALE